MDLLLIVVVMVLGLGLFGVLANAIGADSRESIGDDWTRPIRA